MLFVRSGFIHLALSAGTLRDTGISGQWWASQSYSTDIRSYYLGFGTNVVYASGNGNRYYGFPLRCLSTVLGMGGVRYRALLSN